MSYAMDISVEDETVFITAARGGMFNLNWEDEVGVFTLTEFGQNFLLETIREAATVPDDPIALAAERDMWKERALRVEAELESVRRGNRYSLQEDWLKPLAHNHDLDPSCRETKDDHGNSRGECMNQPPN